MTCGMHLWSVVLLSLYLICSSVPISCLSCLRQALTWNSGNLDAYLAEAAQLVKSVDALLRCIKDAVGQSQSILAQWQRDVMFFERKEGRVYSFEELGSAMRDLIATRHAGVTGALVILCINMPVSYHAR